MRLKSLKAKTLTAYSIAIATGALLIVLPAPASALPWSWDMFDQISVKAQESPALPVPEGSVPRNAEVKLKDRDAAAKLKNPVAPTKESIERGKYKYAISCATCHGEGGKGDGLVGQKYVGPTDLTSDYAQGKTDGDIYYTITSGGMVIMPSYGDAVSPEDRWHIVNYIKRVFGKKEAAGVKKK